MKRVDLRTLHGLGTLNRLPLAAAGVFVVSYLLVSGQLPASSSQDASVLPPVTAPKEAAPKKPAPKEVAQDPKKPQKPPALPRIVAVDRRIAKRTDQLRPNVKKRLVHAAKVLPKGVTLLVTSAYRTSAEQAALQPAFGVKAKPGRSTHEHGRGIDLNVLVDGERVPPRKQQKVIGEAMADAGFRHLGPSDPVHYSIPASELGPEPKEAPELDVPSLDEALEDLEAELSAIAEAPANGAE